VPWSENRRLLNAHPWECTSLGPIAGWPAEMLAVVDAVMSSAFPIWTSWGEDAIQIYNDGYNEIYGNKHPAAFGAPARQSWAEIWDFLDPALEQVRATREPLWFTGTMLPLARNGRPEECYFDFSYSPIKDAQGAVLGVMSVAAERTGDVVRRRRSSLDKLTDLPDDTGLESLSCALHRVLEPNEDDARCAAWLPMDPGSGSAWAVRCGNDFRQDLQKMGEAKPSRVNAFAVAPATARDAYAQYGHQIPMLSSGGRLLGLLAVVTGPLVPRASHRDFCEQLSTRVHAVLRRSETRRAFIDKLRDHLDELDALYRFLFENMQDAVLYCATDPSGEGEEVVLAANRQACALLGYTLSELVGKRREEFFSSGDSLVRDAVAKRGRPRHFVGELSARRKDGEGIPVEISSTLVQLRTGALRSVTIARDISDRIARERERAQSARSVAMTELTGGIAHDFNNFLIVVVGNLDALGEMLPQASAEFSLARDALLGAEGAAALTRQLLTFAKRPPLQFAPVAIPHFLREVRGLLAATLGETNALHLRVPDVLPPCNLDASMLTSALLNLAANARHAMPGGGRRHGPRVRASGPFPASAPRRLRSSSGQLCGDRNAGHRRRHSRGHAASDLRTILHNARQRIRLGTRTCDGAGVRATVGGRCPGHQRSA